MRSFIFRLLPLALFIIGLGAAPSFAQRVGSRSATPAHRMSITISPIHLLFPVLEATGEFRTDDKLGMAGILGVGSIVGYPVFEVGGQGNYYLVGNFEHGMQLGAELLYLHVSGDISDGDESASFGGSGLSIAPYLGYKIAAGFGLTFNIQGGVALLLVRANATDNSGQTGSASGSAVGPLLNINLGWSF